MAPLFPTHLLCTQWSLHLNYYYKMHVDTLILPYIMTPRTSQERVFTVKCLLTIISLTPYLPQPQLWFLHMQISTSRHFTSMFQPLYQMYSPSTSETVLCLFHLAWNQQWPHGETFAFTSKLQSQPDTILLECWQYPIHVKPSPILPIPFFHCHSYSHILSWTSYLMSTLPSRLCHIFTHMTLHILQWGYIHTSHHPPKVLMSSCWQNSFIDNTTTPALTETMPTDSTAT